MATVIWLVSFTRATILWRGHKYFIREGQLVPAIPIAVPRITQRRSRRNPAYSALGQDPSACLSERRSFFALRQFTCGRNSDVSIRSRYRMAMLISESSSDSERRCGCKPSSSSLECFAL